MNPQYSQIGGQEAISYPDSYNMTETLVGAGGQTGLGATHRGNDGAGI